MEKRRVTQHRVFTPLDLIFDRKRNKTRAGEQKGGKKESNKKKMFDSPPSETAAD